MLRDVVGNFLDSLTERQFDGPLLTLLAGRGFTDIHLIHGKYEFGKDVIAKKTDSSTGVTYQYTIQSKAGDIDITGWRAVRPQLEEAEYNTQGHPSFDIKLPRVVVLVTTGSLKGAAPIDASEFGKAMAARGVATLDIWERRDLLGWLCDDPSAGLSGGEVRNDLLSLFTRIWDGTVGEPDIERYTRRWLGAPGSSRQASIEAAILVSALEGSNRLDLALSAALQLFRSARTDPAPAGAVLQATLMLIHSLTAKLLTHVEPLLADPLELARSTPSAVGLLTYPVVCCRLAEAMAIGVVLSELGEFTADRQRFRDALVALAGQPGAARPVSDHFVGCVVAATVALATYDRSAAATYLRAVSQWLLDRYDRDLSGLGLASLYEDEEEVCARLVGGPLEGTTLAHRDSSYLATAVLDLCIHLGLQDLYESVLDNLSALRITPECCKADEVLARWRRGGDDVWPSPHVTFDPWPAAVASPAPVPSGVEPTAALLLTLACRSRHYRGAWGRWVCPSIDW